MYHTKFLWNMWNGPAAKCRLPKLAGLIKTHDEHLSKEQHNIDWFINKYVESDDVN